MHLAQLRIRNIILLRRSPFSVNIPSVSSPLCHRIVRWRNFVKRTLVWNGLYQFSTKPKQQIPATPHFLYRNNTAHQKTKPSPDSDEIVYHILTRLPPPKKKETSIWSSVNFSDLPPHCDPSLWRRIQKKKSYSQQKYCWRQLGSFWLSVEVSRLKKKLSRNDVWWLGSRHTWGGGEARRWSVNRYVVDGSSRFSENLFWSCDGGFWMPAYP